MQVGTVRLEPSAPLEDLRAAARVPHFAPAGQPELAAVEPVDLVAHPVAMGDNVEQFRDTSAMARASWASGTHMLAADAMS